MEPKDFRQALLFAARRSVVRWCGAPHELVDRWRHTDTHWIQLFGHHNAQLVTSTEAHSFLKTFMLTNRVRWDTELVAKIINGLREKRDFDPKKDVPALGLQLTQANLRHTRQTSAASKLATFAKPNADVYIWDKLASKSARFRNWIRADRQGPSRIKTLFLIGADHDYPSFCFSCKLALEEERQRDDFASARDILVHQFRQGTGPMADSELVSDAFIERRLLDKLMFAEGWMLDRHLPPPIEWLIGNGM